ncbi:MAG: APA family basic amino acid/polyamine antiporter, partial [Saprospiraceae bacterium]
MPKLQKKLTLTGLTMIAVGCCIGSGVFLVANQIATALPHPSYILLVWLLGGVIALTGALTFAELGGMFPQSGGVYVFLKEAYGEFVGFLYGWTILTVITTGALAALGVGFAKYLSFFFPEMTQTTQIWIAGITVVTLTGVNIFGVHISQHMANVFTGTKLVAIGGIILTGVFFAAPNQVELNFTLTENVPVNLTSSMLVALVGVLFSVGGWHHASYLAGEAIDAQRTVPKAMIFGVLIVTVMYLLINLSYLLLLPIEAIQASDRVAGDAIATILPDGGKLVAVIITISIFGTISI